MATKPRKGGGELFYLDEDGNKQDAELHEEICARATMRPGKPSRTRSRPASSARRVAEYAAPHDCRSS